MFVRAQYALYIFRNKVDAKQFIIAYSATMELTQLKVFAAVERAHGFSAAADALEMSPSSVTRAVANLEASLGVRLFQRTTRSVTLTEAGERFLARISPALEELDAAKDAARTGTKELCGVLRVSASVSFGQIVIAPHLSDFLAQHPGLRVDLMLSDAVTDLVADRMDVAIRHGDLADSSMIAQRLSRVSYRLVASAAYLQSAKKIMHPDDIADHTCVTFPYPAFRSHWQFHQGRKTIDVDITPSVRISNAVALANCVKSGMGLALLADWTVAQDLATDALIDVLPDWTASGARTDTEPALWILTPSRAFVPTKTKSFISFLQTIAPL